MWRLIAVAASLGCLGGAERKSNFEIRGEILPHAAAAVSLHAVASPFATTTLAGPDGRFRFKNVEAGAYTVSVYVPRRGETRMTINAGPGTADKKGRVTVQVDTHGEALNRQRAATVSARELRIPDRARRAYEEAGRKTSRRDFEGAIASLKRAVEIEPRFAAAWNHLGTIAYQTQRYPDAESYFRKGIEADPDAYEPVVNLGGVLINLGNFDEAWKYNVEAVLRRPNDALAQSQLGMTYMLLNKLDLAEKHLLVARKLDARHFSHPQLHLAEVYVRRNDFNQAAGQLEDFLRHHPDWPEAAKMREAIEQWSGRGTK
jgi:tetratricopeptide (TPR) repeat protein